MPEFDSRKIKHVHIGEKCIRLDTMEDIKTGKKYTLEQIEQLEKKLRKVVT